jgi:hypothetical protein
VGSAEALALKLVITPLLVGMASLAGRRWGSGIGGWLVGIPFTSGPIAFFLAIGQGTHFAAAASVGILAGTVSQAAFALAYAWSARRAGWVWCFAAATIAFLALTVVLDQVRAEALVTFVIAVSALVASLFLMPRPVVTVAVTVRPPGWDIPARMVVATAFVLVLTEAAPALGPRIAGLLSPFPVYATVLAVFAHRDAGAAPAVAVLRGLLLGLFAFAGFFLTLAVLLEPAGIATAFVAALVVALVFQGLSLLVGRRLAIA